MTSRLLLTLLLAVISGELFIPSVAGSENNSVTILSSNSPPKPVETPLFCNCSYTISPLCTRNATCNANSVAQVLRKRAQLMKEIIDKANVFPGDETNNQARDDICHTLRDTEIIDSVLVEYLDEEKWQPACVSLDNDHKICSLAPSGEAMGKMSAAEQNELKKALHNDQLRCGEPTFAEAQHSFNYCRDKSFCNGAHKAEFFILAIIFSSLICHFIFRL